MDGTPVAAALRYREPNPGPRKTDYRMVRSRAGSDVDEKTVRRRDIGQRRHRETEEQGASECERAKHISLLHNPPI